MHAMRKDETAKSGPETAGTVIHWTSKHDILSGLIGLGVNGANSRMIVDMAHIKPGDKVLDVGCGTGDLTLTAQRCAGASVSAYGIDASREGIEIARKKSERSKSGTVFEVGLIERIPYPDATFGVVISRLVIHHLPDDLKRRGFAEILRVLKPGGLVFIADFKVPGNPILAHLMLALVGHRMMMQSNVSSYPQMLRQAGFIDVATGPTRSAFLAFVNGRKANPLAQYAGEILDLSTVWPIKGIRTTKLAKRRKAAKSRFSFAAFALFRGFRVPILVALLYRTFAFAPECSPSRTYISPAISSSTANSL